MSEVNFMAVSQWDTVPVDVQERIATGQMLQIIHIGEIVVPFSGIVEPKPDKPQTPDPYINDLSRFAIRHTNQ